MTDETEDPLAEAEYTMEELLLSGEVLEETPDGTDLRLTEEFEQQWHELNTQMRGSDRAKRWLAQSRDLDPDAVEATSDGDLFVLEADGDTIGKWPSEAAFVAETVARPTLRERLGEEWDRLPEDAHRELSARLLLFLERCPACDGDLVFDEELEDDSVRVSLACSDCGSALFSGRAEQEEPPQ